jgi:hypothetical protein
LRGRFGAAGKPGQVDDQIVSEGFVRDHLKLVVVLAVIAVIVIGYAGYLGVSSYEGAVVSTSVTTGKVTNIQSSSSVISSGNQVVPPVTRVTITVGSTSFDAVLSCSSTSYRVGNTVKVADQLLRSGAHQYAPDVACKGDVSPFQALYPSSTTSSSTSHT